MAKQGRKKRGGNELPGGRSDQQLAVDAIITPELESRIEGFAEDLGSLLGTARNKADAWMSQREAIVKQLSQLRDAANGYLQKLVDGYETGNGARARRISRQQSDVVEGPDGSRLIKKPRTLSAEARARIAAAQKKRWAKFRKAKKGGAGVGNG